MTRAVFATALVLLACNSSPKGGTGASEPTLSSMAVKPTAPTIAAGATQQFTATGTYADGTAQDLTGRVTWSSSTATVATISAAGLTSGAGAGTTTVSGTMSGVTGSTTLTVTTGVLTVTTVALPGGYLGVAYSAALAASGGAPPYAWSLATGALPPGLSLDAGTGAITGTPTAAGTSAFTAQVADAANATAARTLSLATGPVTPPPAGPEPAGWFAGDMHVHRSCGGSPKELSDMYQLMSPNDLAAISLLADMGNGEVQDAAQDLARVNGQDAPVSTPGRIVHWDGEWHWDATYRQYAHQALGGHVVVLGVSEDHQIWEEYTYPIFTWAHQAGGIAGFAHLQYLDDDIPQTLTCCTPIEYPVEVALGSSDFISEDVVDANSSVGGMDPESAIRAYYRLLNCGFRPGLAAGTDYPCNSGRDVGSLLTYVQVAGGQMTYRNWIDGIAKGRTVVSRNGHSEFLNLIVNSSATPGDEIKLMGAGSMPVTVEWTASQGLSGTIELVQNGVVVASKQASVAAGAPASLSGTVNFTKSGWLAARRMGSTGHQIHTAAVFVTVNDAPVRASAADASFYVQWMDSLLEKTSPGGVWSSYFPTSRSAAQARYQLAKDRYQQIAAEAAATP